MLELQYARQRIQAVLAEIERVSQFEFPYRDSLSALQTLEGHFQRSLERLMALDEKSDPAVRKQQCRLSIRDLFAYLPVLGFIVRSTNVRNSFEMFRPLRRLARSLLEPGIPEADRKTRLVLSSEWYYSPFVYRELPELPGFVLIGLPAPESSNPLLIPLAGHELGHALWAKHKLSNQFGPQVHVEVIRAISLRWAKWKTIFKLSIEQGELATNLLARETWSQAVAWAMNQAEETFCDFVGLRLFGTSYLHAFAYLLSPSFSGWRAPEYPNLRTRVTNLANTARQFGILLPDDFVGKFEDVRSPPLSDEDSVRLVVADEALSAMVTTLVDAVD